MTTVEKERLCQQELAEIHRLIDLDTSGFPADVEAALRFLHAHLFEESLNASRVQREDGLHSHNLPARFKRHLGLGLRDYIEDRRMLAAMRLLWHREIEIYLVAAAVGYAHHETFTRAFKRRIGCTPSDFRTHFAPAAVSPVEVSPSVPQPSEVPMFITDVVGIRAAEETYELRVSGTAAGLTEVYVHAAAGGESRSQVADVEPGGEWVAFFEGGVFACGRPLEVEVGTEGRAHVRWEGLLDCAEMAPRRGRAREDAAEADQPAARAASRTHQDGGAYSGDAAMTVTVAAGRGPAPPAVGETDGDDGSFYEPKPRRRPPAREPESDEGRGEPRRAAAADEVRALREEMAALRSEIGALAQRAERAEPTEQRGDASAPDERRHDSPRSRRETDDRTATEPAAASESEENGPSGVQEQIDALRRELRERWDAQAADDSAQRTDEPDEVEDEAAGDETAEPPWQRAILDLQDQIEGLRTGDEADDDFDSDDDPDDSDADEHSWQRAIAGLKEQIDSLRDDTAARRQRDAAPDDRPDDDPEARADEPRADDACDDEAASAAENREDLYDAVRALRQRIVELESGVGQTARSADSDSPAPSRRAPARRSSSRREQNADERGVGVLARQPAEEQRPAPVAPRLPNAGDGDRRDAPAVRREDAPVVRFEPVEVGDWTDEGRREVRVRARVTHPARQPVAAELVDDRDGSVLADGRSERGTLRLDEWVEVEPGTVTFTVTVTEPSPASLSMAWTLDDGPRADRDGEAAADKDDDDESAGWVSRAIGGAWAVTVALFLLAIAAGVHDLLRGLVLAGFLGFLGSYLSLTVPRRWGLWTVGGIGFFALLLVVLLPFTPIVQMDRFLLIAGLAGLGLAGSAVVALFVSKDESDSE